MVRLEIELLGDKVQDDIFDLRNYLKEHIPDADFVIKEQAPLPGQMSLGIEPILGGVLHAISAIVLEELYRNLLKPVLDKWIQSRKQASSKLEIMSSLSEKEEKVHFLETSQGLTEVYNSKYAINTDKTYVLLIGVGKFTSDFNPIPPVKGNLEDFYKLLVDKKHIGIPRENVTVSFNESHVEIQKQLLQASRKPDMQTLLIYFAGHGHRSDVKRLSLIASDTEKVGDEVIGGIDFDFVSSKVLKSTAARQKILILDTCHSGIAAQGGEDPVPDIDVKGSYILTSSPGDDVSYFEKDAKHTYFTGALLEVLQNGIDNTQEMLALTDLYEYTREVLGEKKFPAPNAKNDLNIVPSNFFIARNPSFSEDKLKWRAYNLYRDGKLEEALDEFRVLLKRFPDDRELRRQFEECETEFSFSKCVNEANALFYEQKKYPQAAVLYQKAYKLKKDAMVLEKIRQCELQPAVVPVPDPLSPVKEDANFKAFFKAGERKAFYTAFQYLKKVKQAFPNNRYVNEEMTMAESKLKEIADGRKDERLNNYYSLLDKGEMQQALNELKLQISNDPEYPAFLTLQRNLLRQLRQQEEGEKEKQDSSLFRLFQTLSTRWKAVVLITLLAAILSVVVIYIKEESRPGLSALRQMLFSNPEKAIGLLEEKGKEDDSAKLVLGDYYKAKSDYPRAFTWYEGISLPAARHSIKEMYNNGQLPHAVYTDSLKEYYERILLLGPDTGAFANLGSFALGKYYADMVKDSIEGATGHKTNWQEAVDDFEEGVKNGSVHCKQYLGDMYYKRGASLELDGDYKKSYPYFLQAAYNGNGDAMAGLGYINNSWKRYDSSERWYKLGMDNNNAVAFGNMGSLILYRNNSLAGYDSAYRYLTIAKMLKPAALTAAYYSLGLIFQHGGFTTYQNMDSAKYYYKIAADKGYQAAKDSLRALAFHGFGSLN